MEKKYLITTGDPNGIGPEIILKAALKGRLSDCDVIGSFEVFKYYADKLSLDFNDKLFRIIDAGADIKLSPGECTPEGGGFALRCLDMAIKLLKKGDYSHLITAPLSKKGVSYHIPDFIGHTEYLAQAFNTKDFSMMLANETFRVVLVTTHVSIRELPDLITKESVVRAVYNADNFLKSVGDERGIGVCALNPHAGEDGLLGDEEIKVIIPAVRKAIEDGIKVSGPYPADSLFKSVYNNPYGVYVAMYHDQGLGPLKMVSKGRGVNITLGLPVFRISVDHGTAYDIAGKGIASEESLVEAIEIAKKVII